MFKRWLRQTTMATMVALAPMAVHAQDTPSQGGEIVVTYKDDITTLDPAIGYDWVNWSMIKSLYSRLMDYAPGTPNPVPSLAESFEVAPDGLTYTFKLRKGVKFSNGREVVASDVKYSIERAVDPKTQGPGAGFFGAIQGFEDLTGGKATTLSGIETPDEGTVIFKLSRPDATFLHVLAINFASVVPKEAVEEAAGDFGKKPVGSGTFILKDWTIGQHLVFEKNPDYYVKDVPHIDKFTVEVGQEPLVALLRLQKGEVDIAGDGIPPAKFLEIKNSADGAQMIVDGEQLHTGYVTLNTKVKPFDNVKVRQALNMAIDRQSIVTNILQGMASPRGTQVGAADFGYKDLPVTPYDPAKAKALLAEAGLPNGFSIKMQSTHRYMKDSEVAQAIAQQFGDIGVKIDQEVLDWSVYTQQVPRKGPIFMLGWGSTQTLDADAAVYAIFKTGEPYSTASIPELDKLLDESRSIVDPAKREAVLAQIQDLAAEQVPVIPLYQEDALYGKAKSVTFEGRPDARIPIFDIKKQ